MIWPSGFRDGTRRRTTSFKRRRVSGSLAVASACAHSIAICEAPISVEWMLHVTSRTSLPSFSSRSASAFERPRGSASLFAISRMRLTFLMFSSEEMTAMNMSSPSVVLPRTWMSTRGEAAFAICR